MAYDEILITLVSLEGLGRPMIDAGRTIGGQAPQAPRIDGASGSPNENVVTLPTNPAGSNYQAPTGQVTAANQEKPGSKGDGSQISGMAFPESASLEPYAAKNIHQIVRDYYCFQLAMKKMFYEGQPNTRNVNKHPETRTATVEHPDRTEKASHPREGHYGYMSDDALNSMCGITHVEPGKTK